MAPLFDRYSGCGSKGIVCESYAGARGAYERRTQAYGERSQCVRGRTQYAASIRTISRTVFSLRVSWKFRPSLREFPRFLRFSDRPRVAASPRLAQPGWKPCHLGCPRVPASRQAGTPWVHLGSAAPPGQPNLLDYVVYASCSSTSSGALGRMPWGTQGLFWDALNKGFSFRKEVRPGSRSC